MTSPALTSAYQIALRAKHEPPAGWPMPGLPDDARGILAAAVSLIHADALPVQWTTWPHAKEPHGVVTQGTWREFGLWLTAQRAYRSPSKMRCPGWAPTVFTNADRLDANVTTIYALTLDCDDHGDWDRALATLAELGLAYFAHRSPTHGALGATKWRLVLPLAVPVTDIAQWQACYAAGRAILGAIGWAWFDPSCSNPSRLWFFGVVGDGEPREVLEREGMALDLAKLAAIVDLASKQPPPSRVPLAIVHNRSPGARSPVDRAERWLERVEGAIQGQGGDDLTFRVAAKLVRDFDLSDADALALLERWNGRCVPAWTSAELAQKVSNARKYGSHAEGEALSQGPAQQGPAWRAAPDDLPPTDTPGDTPTDYIDHADEAAPNDPDVDEAPKPKRKRLPKVKWPRTNDKGEPYPHVENTAALLTAYGVTVSFNLMTHEAEHVFANGFDVAGECQRNASEAQVREWANERRIFKAARFADQMTVIIATRAYHPVANWIRSKPWDGVDRIGDLFDSLTIAPKFLKEHAAHARRILEAWLITSAKAALMPVNATEGIAAQGVLVLQGPQGRRKTRWLMSLVPAGRGWAKEGVLLDPTNRDSKQQATDAWIVELGELDGTFRKADMAHLKGFLTSRTDTYRRAYAKTHETMARRTVFVASVNETAYLVDDTGSRRFWTLPVIEANPEHGVDLQQLWAQAARRAETQPERGWLTADEAEALSGANKPFEVLEPVLDDLRRVFKVGTLVTPDDPLVLEMPGAWWNYDQIRKALRPNTTWTRADTIALGRALTKLGAPERSGKESARLFGLESRSPIDRGDANG